MTGESWFDDRTAGLIGGIAGSVVGVWGAVFGTLCARWVPRGKGRPFLIGSLWAVAVLGVGSLLVGVTALSTGQPYAVWYGFLLLGVLMTVLAGAFIPTLRKRYREAELRKMNADELG